MSFLQHIPPRLPSSRSPGGKFCLALCAGGLEHKRWDNRKEQAQRYALIKGERSRSAVLFGRAAIHPRDTSLPAAAFKTLHPSGRSGLALSLLTAPAPPGPSVPKRAQERRLGTSRPTVPTHAGGRARRDATREERSETGVTRDGERALPAAGPGEALSHGRGYSRHIRSLLTLEKQQSVRQSADPRAGRGAGRAAAGRGDSAT